MKSFGIILAMATLIACKSDKYPSEVNKIEELIKQVDRSSTVLVGIDTSGLSAKWKSYKSNTEFITGYYKSNNDTIDASLAMILAEYKQLKKPYSEFKEVYSEAFEELKFSKNQLITLKHDLEKGILEPQLAQKMVIAETEATNRILTQVKQLVKADSVTLVKTEIYTPKIDSVISSIQKNQ